MEPFATIATALRADPAWTVADIADNHFAPINAPDLTANALLALV
jgi:hypothetical protein